MLASVGSAIPSGAEWTFEPKYDGVRVLAFATPRRVELRTRNGIDKAKQFPEIVDSALLLSKSLGSDFVLDGEIVARNGDELGRFQLLQERLHQRDTDIIARHVRESPARLVGLDLLVLGDDILIDEPWRARRRALERILSPRHLGRRSSLLLGESLPGDGDALMQRARREGWEGIMAKRMDVPYTPGRRSPHWLKLKIEGRQELVVGGWTEPRRTRQHIGALLLGYFDNHGDFVYAGHTGSGFTNHGLREMYDLLKPLERKTSSFVEEPHTNEKPHWTRPHVVVEVKFNEWTKDGRLRQPIFLGIRDDKDAKDVRRERSGTIKSSRSRAGVTRVAATQMKRATKERVVRRARVSVPRLGSAGKAIADIEANGGDGHLALGRNGALDVTSLDKIFFPKSRITKGDLMAYYAAVAPAILPFIKGRPLVLKRYPDGVDAEPFYQQNAPPKVPDGVRSERVDASNAEGAMRLIGGDVATLLYCVQLGCIEVHPWHSRLPTIDDDDYTILDLDPGDGAPFSRVVDVARHVHEELQRCSLSAALKTSGASGLHIYVPLPTHTSYESGRLVAELIATRIADAFPNESTVVRAVKKRPKSAVYVDYLQNVEGKSVAAPFSVRPHEPGSVSTPLDWKELTDSLDPVSFTMERVLRELSARRALWREGMKRRNSLRALRTLQERS